MSIELFYPEDDQFASQTVIALESEVASPVIDETKKNVIAVIPEEPNTVNGNSVSDEELFGDTRVGVIPRTNTVIDVINGKQEKLINLQHLEAQLMGEQNITREMASYIHEKTNETFFNERLTLECFTPFPTKIFFDESLRFIKKNIAKEQHELSIVAQELGKTYNELFIGRSTEELVTKLQEIKTQYDQLKTRYLSVWDALAKGETNKFIFRINNEFISLATVPLAGLQINHIDLPSSFEESFQNNEIEDVIKNIVELVDNVNTMGFFYALDGDIPMSDVIQFNHRLLIKDYSQLLTLTRFAQLLTTKDIVVGFDNLITTIETNSKTMVELTSQLQPGDEFEAQRLNWIKENTSTMNSLIEFNGFVTDVVARGLLVVGNFRSLMEFLKICVD